MTNTKKSNTKAVTPATSIAALIAPVATTATAVSAIPAPVMSAKQHIINLLRDGITSMSVAEIAKATNKTSVNVATQLADMRCDSSKKWSNGYNGSTRINNGKPFMTVGIKSTDGITRYKYVAPVAQ